MSNKQFKQTTSELLAATEKKCQQRWQQYWQELEGEGLLCPICHQFPGEGKSCCSYCGEKKVKD